MPLGVAPLPIQFGGGVDTRTDSKQVATVKLIDLQNCVFTKLTTLSKRNGYRALSTLIQNSGEEIANARGLAERDGEVLVFTDKRCYSQRPSADRWADTGEVAATSATTLPIARTGTYQTQPDGADRNGVRVEAWEDSRGGVWCSVFESETGRILLSQTQLDSAALARNVSCVAVGEVLHVIWTREDLGSIQLAVVNPAAPGAAPVSMQLTNDLDLTKPFFDVVSAPNGDALVFSNRPALIAWARAGGGFRVGWIVSSGVFASALIGMSGVADYNDLLNGPLACAWDGIVGTVAVMWSSTGGTVKGRFLNGAALGTTKRSIFGGVTVVVSRIAAAFGGVTNVEGGDGFPILYWVGEITAARSDLTQLVAGMALQTDPINEDEQTFMRGHGLVSRAWHDGEDVYVMIAHTVRFFPYVAAMRISQDFGISSKNTIVSRLIPGEGSGSLMRTTGAGTRAWTQHLPSATQEDLGPADIYSRTHAISIPYRIQLSSQNGDQFSEQGIKRAVINFLPAYQTAQLGRNLYLSSSSPMSYDGDTWHEADFHTAPDFGFNTAGAPVDMATTITPVAGGSIANGTYLYVFWYEVVDAQGELHRGSPSIKMLVTMTGGPRSFSMAIPTCRLTRFTNVRICVARSPQGATGTDSSLPLFRVTSNDVTITTGSNRYITNNPDVDTVTFVDGLDDLTLKTREPLYTNGGILPNAPAPWGGGVIAVGKSRLYWTDTTDPHIVRYSQQIADDTALEAPVDLTLRKDPFGGPITALGILDDSVIPFSRTAVYVFAGPGPLADPSAAPEANAFTPIDRVSTDVGCVDARSVGETPVGLTFKSAKGIMMLTRNREIVNIGNDVQKYDAQNVVRASLIPTSQRILYLTDSGRTLMWDYNRNSWSTFTNHEGLDAVVLGDLYYYLRTDSRVYVETPGLYRDDTTNIVMAIETAWIHFAPYLQGWQRILYAYFLGQFITLHTLSVRYRLDYNDSYSPEITSDVNANYTPSQYGVGSYGVGPYGGPVGGGTRYQRRIHINRRCQSISFLISDIEAAGDYGASFELSEMLLLGGGLGPDFKVGAARSA